jgi:hypothetical protein
MPCVVEQISLQHRMLYSPKSYNQEFCVSTLKMTDPAYTLQRLAACSLHDLDHHLGVPFIPADGGAGVFELFLLGVVYAEGGCAFIFAFACPMAALLA